jgi:hypothetical protein
MFDNPFSISDSGRHMAEAYSLASMAKELFTLLEGNADVISSLIGFYEDFYRTPYAERHGLNISYLDGEFHAIRESLRRLVVRADHLVRYTSDRINMVSSTRHDAPGNFQLIEHSLCNIPTSRTWKNRTKLPSKCSAT